MMIIACGMHGYDEEVFDLFYQTKRLGSEPNEFTFSSVLFACAQMVDLEKGKEIIKGGSSRNSWNKTSRNPRRIQTKYLLQV